MDENLEKVTKQLIDLCVDIYAHEEIGSQVHEVTDLVDEILESYTSLSKDDYFFKQAVREKVKELKIYYHD
jgi:tRNA A-37 threonylcarbamoyl transferase component Bud32